jgi:hypothetical protein
MPQPYPVILEHLLHFIMVKVRMYRETPINDNTSNIVKIRICHGLPVLVKDRLLGILSYDKPVGVHPTLIHGHTHSFKHL